MSTVPAPFPLSSERGLFATPSSATTATVTDLDAATLRRALAKWCELDLPVGLFATVELARDRTVKAALAQGRSRVLVIGADPTLAHADAESIPLPAIRTASARITEVGRELAAVLLEPRGELAVLRAIVTASRAQGAALLIDETRTAGRLTAKTVSAELEIEPDALLLGPSLSEGRPFAAVLGLADASAEIELSTLAAVQRTLTRLRREPVSDRLSERGMALRERFTRAARRVGSSARLVGPAALMAIEFRDEPELPAEAIASKWRRDLRALGFQFDDDVLLGADDPLDLDDTLAAAFERALVQQQQHLVAASARIRSLDSTRGDRLRGLGATTSFVHPSTGRAEVVSDARGLTLKVDSGPLGPATSVGVVSKDLCQGDVRVEVEVELEPWSCDGGEAVFALLATDVHSARRLQVVVGRRDAHPGRFAAAGFDGGWGDEIELLGSRFVLAIERRGGRFTCFIASVGPNAPQWIALGEFSPAQPSGSLAIGCRVVGRITAQDLSARLLRFSRTSPLA